MHPYVYLFGIPMSSYSLMGMLGLAVAGLYVGLTNRGRKAGFLYGQDMLHVGCLAAVGAIVGAKVLHTLTMVPVIVRNWELLMQPENDGMLLSLLTSGFVFYGGAIGGVAAVYWYCRRYGVPFKSVLGLMTPAIPLFHAFGRVGCFLGGCCWGIEVHWGIEFTHSLGAPNGVPLLPVQLIESGLNLLVFAFTAWLSRRLVRKWLVMPAYIVCYSVLRFTLEFFRGDAERGVWLLSTSQWISLALFAGTVVLYFTRWRKQPVEPEFSTPGWPPPRGKVARPAAQTAGGTIPPQS